MICRITLVFQEIHEEYLDYDGEVPQFSGDLIAIQHCREGRFEGEYPDGECIYMGPGNLSVNLPAWAPVTNSFPLRHYHGFYIAILPCLAEASIVKLEQILGPMGIMFSGLVEHLSERNRLALYSADEKTAGVISSMYEAYGEGREERLRLQVLELLQLLSTQEGFLPAPEQYFPRDQVAAIKEIRQYLVSHLDQHIPLPELADRFRISLTGMKLCFKGVYGQSIGRYLREYRMQAGAEQLKHTDRCHAGSVRTSLLFVRSDLARPMAGDHPWNRSSGTAGALAPDHVGEKAVRLWRRPDGSGTPNGAELPGV